RIWRANGEFVIEDLGSTNGTFVNRRKISGPEVLSAGDRIQVGATTLVVQVSVPLQQPPAAAPPDADTRSSAQTPMPEPLAAEPAVEPSAAEPAVDPSAAAPEAPAPLSLRLHFDPAAGEVTLELGEGAEPVRLVYEDGRWRIAPDAGE
ncbi:MAG: FHA domain-containing protein, partial [Thermoleophilaceae bacterium]